MTIKNWPSPERPREKLLAFGAQALSDAELLAIFLRTGVPGKTAVDLARDLLNEFGGLRQILEVSQQRFCECRGLGIAKYAQLQAILEMSKRHLHEAIGREDVITNPTATRKYLMARMRQYEKEVFICLSLDSRNRVISFDELFQGSIDATTIYPREVVKLALSRNAAAVIFAHNHPSGVAEPSIADRQSTHQLMKALESVEVKVLDHLIIGDTHAVSMAERGYL